jgi:hypothetical protein
VQRDWAKLRENDVFKHRIPLPQSNSGIAKEMRVAIVLGALSKLVDSLIFQPTFVLHEDSGLRELLCHQAVIDPIKERYTRGILLSMFPENQENTSKENIGIVVKELLDIVNVRVLLSPEAVPGVEKALQHLVTQFWEEWKVIQRGKQKLEPSFNYSASTNLPWHVLDMECAHAHDGKHTEAPVPTDDVEDHVVIVPRVYLIGAEAEPKPVTHGYVLRKAQLDAAADEIRRDRPNAPFAQAPSTRHRGRPGRGMSVTSDAVSSGRSGQGFLY